MAAPPRPPGPNQSVFSQIGEKHTQGVPPPLGVDELTGNPISVVSQSPIDRNWSRAFIEVHRHDGRTYDLTPWCKAASWTPSLAEPWTSISVTCVLPFANRFMAPGIGDWIVIRSLQRTPYAWGVVVEEPVPGIEGGLGNAGSAIASAPITFAAVSWLRYLRNAPMFASPYSLAGRDNSIGTFFAAEDWTSIIYGLQSAMASGQLGQALILAVAKIARLRLPPTLGGGYLGDAVNVVYDAASAQQAGLSGLTFDACRGPRIMNASQAFPDTTNALDFLMGIFVPDKQLVEFWETLAPLRQESQSGRDALGAVPCLIYRLRPWRTEPLGDYMARNTPGGQSAAPATQTLVTGGTNAGLTVPDPDAALVAAYSAPTWVPSQGVTLDVDEDGISLPAPKRSDSERINAVTLGLPTQADSPLRFWQAAGLPFADWGSVDKYAFRPYQPNWPYLPPSPTKATANSALGTLAQQGATQAVTGANAAVTGSGQGQTLPGFIRTMAGLVAMMFIGQERLLKGRIVCGYGRPRVPIGVPVTVSWPGGNRFVGYIEAAEHRVDFGGPQGQVSGNTTLTYSRGAWVGTEDRDSPARLPVTVESVPVRAQKAPEPAAQRVTRGERIANQPVLFAGGGIPWVSPFSLDRWLLTKPLEGRYQRRQTSITQAVLHYTDGNVNSLTASGAYATFNNVPTTTVSADSNNTSLPTSVVHVASTRGFASRGSFNITLGGVTFSVSYTSKTATSFVGCTGGSGALAEGMTISTPGVDSHFIIEADGTVVQVMDLAITAYQAGVSVVNRKSVGIDFVCPELVNRLVEKAPWQFKTGYTLVPSPDTTSRQFYAPTTLQIASARALLIWCRNNLAVPLTAPAATGDPHTVRYYPGAWPAGVYHHAEVFKGRQDCLGIYIPTDLL